MKKFLIGIACGFAFAGVAALIVAAALVRLASSGPALPVPRNAILVLDLSGDVPEQAPAEIPIPGFETRSPLTTVEIWNALKRAATDSNIEGLAIMPGRIGAGWAKLEQIRQSVEDFKARSRKPVLAFLKSPGNREYYLATAADAIYVTPEDHLDLKGLRAELTFFRETLDKVGARMEVAYAGKYKDGLDSFVEKGSRASSREVINSILDTIYGHFTETVAGGRDLDVAKVRELFDDGPYLAVQAKEKSLIDDVLYEDQFFEKFTKVESRRADGRRLSLRSYHARAGGGSGSGARVAYIVGQGAILRGSNDDADDGIYSADFVSMLRGLRYDSSVQGAIMRIDSPGGDAIASDDILRELKLLSKAKPLVISMSDVAASGGYFIAATGDPIVAYRTTITGSIGVYFGKINLRGLYDKLGIRKEIFERGRNAAIDTDYRPLTGAGSAKLVEGVAHTYKGFVDRVAEARKKKFDEIDAVAQGRAWMGAEALKNGLVDEAGGIDRAVEMIRKRLKLTASQPLQLVPYPARKSIFDRWLSAASRYSRQDPPAALARQLVREHNLQPLIDGGMLALLPYSVTIK